MNRADLDPLLAEGIRAARFLLDKNGEFFPFGVVLAKDGTHKHVQGWTGEERPPSDDILKLLVAGFRSEAAVGSLRATALVADVRVARAAGERKTDAIRVTLEHEDGTAVECFLPYRKSWLKGITYGEVFASSAQRAVFPPVSH